MGKPSAVLRWVFLCALSIPDEPVNDRKIRIDFTGGYRQKIVMSIGERIKQARIKAGLSQADLAKYAGRSQSAVAEWETGATAPRRNIVEKIASTLGVSVHWLEIGGADDPQRPFDDGFTPSLPASANSPNRLLGPIFASVPSGGSDRAEQRIIAKKTIEYRPKPSRWTDVKNLYGLYVATDSMMPRINPGELIWVHPQRQPQFGQEAVFVRRSLQSGMQKEIMVKICAGHSPTKWIAKQFNPIKEFDLKKIDWECHLIVQIELNR